MPPSRPTAEASARPLRLGPFLRRALVFVVPAAVVWWILTPAYNRLLIGVTEGLVRLSEIPDPKTRLYPYQTHYFLLHRVGLRGPGTSGHLYSVRVTDTHFPVIFTSALFLAVPLLRGQGRSSQRRRLFVDLGWALLISAAFHLVSLFFWVKFAYATQMGAWSLEHYGAFSRNFWGLGKHLLDLPFKFALPLILWAAFYLPLLQAREVED